MLMLVYILGDMHCFFVYANQHTWKCALFLFLCKSMYLEMCTVISLFMLIYVLGNVVEMCIFLGGYTN